MLRSTQLAKRTTLFGLTAACLILTNFIFGDFLVDHWRDEPGLGQYIALLALGISLCLNIIIGILYYRSLTTEFVSEAAHLSLLQQVTDIANSSISTREAFAHAIDLISREIGCLVGHIYLRNSRSQLEASNVWYSSDSLRFSSLRNVRENLVVSLELQRGDFVFQNLADCPDLKSIIARQCGLSRRLLIPVMHGQNVAAVIELYDISLLQRAPALQKVLAACVLQMGRVIDRERAQQRAILLETVIASANDGVIITNADFSENGPEVIYVNRGFTAITEYTREEVLGRPPSFLRSNGQADTKTLDEMRLALMQGKPFKGELINHTKTGVARWIDVSVSPIRDESDVITSYAGIIRDITERKRAEEIHDQFIAQLRRMNENNERITADLASSLEAAEKANQAKSDFLANMSHELRTPMNGVIGMASLLADTQLTDEQGEYVTSITSSAESLRTLLCDILDISKIEAGALTLESIPFYFREVIRDTSALLRPLAEIKGINLDIQVAGDVPPAIWGDPARLRQIINNLVGNAIKFTHSGSVTIAAELQAHAGNLLISVIDTGIGIPAEKMSTIFEKFTQADASITRRYGGTGLGLAITKQLVNLMSGEINVSSTSGQGSVFWFTLPLRLATADDIKHLESIQDNGPVTGNRLPVAASRVLIVEDYPVNQVFAQKLLAKFGFRDIDLAENGLMALDACRRKKYDAIFMDCQMPVMDGLQATEKLREINNRTPIIAMTANAMIGDQERCLKAGMDDYISKPLKPELLRKILGRWFEMPDVGSNNATGTRVADTPVNLAQLRSFTDGDAEEENMLVSLFLEQAHKAIDSLTEQMAQEDGTGWKSTAHRLKGASGNLGAQRLSHLCKRAEMNSNISRPDKQIILTAIGKELTAVEAYLRREIQAIGQNNIH